MKRVLVVCIVALAASAAQAMVVIDADAFAPGTDISNAFPGVTLSAIGPGWNGATGVVVAVDPTDFNPSTGSLVFGSDDASWPSLWREAGLLQLRVDFSSPVSNVMLDFISDDDSDIGVLYAYDASNTLLDSAMTGALGYNSVGTLTVTGGGIAYVIAGGNSVSSALGLDNLRYDGVVPAPAAIMLGSIGMGLVGWLRRRRAL